MNELGIMQGRLSAPVVGRVQVFPFTSWEDEFARARDCGFEAIEWLFDAERFEENPLWNASGRRKIRALTESTGVRVRSVCADYFMAHPLFRATPEAIAARGRILETLIAHADDVGIDTVLLPVLEASEIKTDDEKTELLLALDAPLRAAAACRLRIGLETELPVHEFRALIEAAGHPALGAYYDTGNAAARGFEPAFDIHALGSFLVGVHLKDRTRNGPSVPLGKGGVCFESVFSSLRAVEYSGLLVVQSTSRADFRDAASEHLTLVRNRWHAVETTVP